MRHVNSAALLSVFIGPAAGCALIAPNQAPDILQTQALDRSTASPKLAVDPTKIPESVPTLSSDQVSQKIAELMAKNGGCLSPCFWGIYPDLVAPVDALNFFSDLSFGYGSMPVIVSENDRKEYGFAFINREQMGIE